MAEQHLGQYSLSVIGGYQLQAGSSAQEFGAFMKTLEDVGRGTKTLWAHLVHTMYNKLVIAGNISSLGVICYLIGQLWYNGSKIIKSLKIWELKPHCHPLGILLWNCRIYGESQIFPSRLVAG